MATSNFDKPFLTSHSHDLLLQDNAPDEGREMVAEYKKTVQLYHKFIREFSVGAVMKYRQRLTSNYAQGDYFLEVDFDDLLMFNADAAANLKRHPARFVPALEAAAKDVADELTKPRPEGHEQVQAIQVILMLNEIPCGIRKIKSTSVAQTIRISGIVVAASQVRARASRVTLQCRTCRHVIKDLEVKPGLEGFALPRRCAGSQQSALQRCPMDPYHIVPDKCECVDFQTLKLQETPEDIPHGEMPRHMLLYVDRYLTDKVVPGNRITVTGILSIRKMFTKQAGKGIDKTMSGIRSPYVRVLGISIETSGAGRTDQKTFTPEEERQFKELAKSKNVYETIAKSIAPSIYGSDDIKRSIACLLLGGSRKRLPDGLTRRGDINVLLLGDPGTAKSQLLKFVEKVSPVAVYTSGKGSSAAGLTASVIRDPQSRSFIMEGGAMVLADGGVVCIDEFDKMREDDRVAIHEAMEQQTISIAKAGITTTLNSRCSVLAAANSVFGRWDDSKGDENIDFMPTILSRFDMIYVVKDTHDEIRDAALAKHVLSVHMGMQSKEKEREGELSLDFLKKFISYARANCAPRLSAKASEKLINNYVKMRNPAHDVHDQKRRHKSAIPITVRQLEAIIRTSEALAKMELRPFADETHVDEALRLFQVSTMAAAASGNLAGIEGFTSAEDHESFNRIEKQMKKRFAIGTYVSEQLIISEFVKQSYSESLVRKVIQYGLRRGDLQYRLQRKMLCRVK